MAFRPWHGLTAHRRVECSIQRTTYNRIMHLKNKYFPTEKKKTKREKFNQTSVRECVTSGACRFKTNCTRIFLFFCPLKGKNNTTTTRKTTYCIAHVTKFGPCWLLLTREWYTTNEEGRKPYKQGWSSPGNLQQSSQALVGGSLGPWRHWHDWRP
jgi:hypothetical protein